MIAGGRNPILTIRMDTETRKIKLFITDDCLLNCRYCFVRKGRAVMSETAAKDAVRFLAGSDGAEKAILLYGGEPLLAFDLIRTIVRSARLEAGSRGKSVAISVATNGLSVDESKLTFFRENRVKLSISIDGDRETHVADRLAGSPYAYENVTDSIRLALDVLSPENVSALVAVTPENAKKLYENLSAVRRLGVANFNIEPIQGDGYRWTDEEVEAFGRNLDLFVRDMFKWAKKGTFVFLGSVTRALLRSNPTAKGPVCPFRENMEVHPSGDIFLSPFLANMGNRERFVVGNFPKGFRKEYEECPFDGGSEACRSCWERYGGDMAYSGARVVELRDSISGVFAAVLVDLAKRDEAILKYVSESERRVFE